MKTIAIPYAGSLEPNERAYSWARDARLASFPIMVLGLCLVYLVMGG